MSQKSFGANWMTQQLNDIHPKRPTFDHVYTAHIKPIRFFYPLDWYQGINVYPQYSQMPGGSAEYGFVSTADWQVQSGAPLGIWFFVGAIPMPTACYGDTKLVNVISKQVVTIKGLTQKVYYCETITSPAYDPPTFIANFGLLSVHVPPVGRFSINAYLACHPSADNWFVYNTQNPGHTLFQFGSHTFGLVPAESSEAFNSQAQAVHFFTTQDYQTAKQIILSTSVGS